MEYYNYLKSLHLIFIVTWFAGLFYVPRLFMYQIEASEKQEPDRSILGDQLAIMTKRLWKIITWPSMILASIFALAMLHISPGLLELPWMQIKLGFVVLLYVYHFKNHQIYKQLQAGNFKYTTKFMRIWNEGPTLILFAVVFLVITKSATNWIWGLAGLLTLAILLMLGIKLYKSIREKNPNA
ncbi:CopD family protein [Leeuwenhoekiella sp. W20_SRS_FM14]|uniref:CopD family protein n=1 Tax=Leeuwenhoekiella sp. W20_SRS_FM14 TaxID=3240270 RepID=UPI003F9C4BBC